MSKQETDSNVIEKTRVVLVKKIEETEELIENLMDKEPENDESAAYERWEDKVSEAEDIIERCQNKLEELRQLADSLGIQYKEADFIC